MMILNQNLLPFAHSSRRIPFADKNTVAISFNIRTPGKE